MMISDIEFFPWNANFDTGIEIIDEQHKKLVLLLNKLAGHLAYRSDAPTLNSVFNQLTDYASYHFQTEETIWQEFLSQNDLLAKHQEVHDKFIAEVLKLKAEEEIKPLEQVIEDVLSFLTHWLVFHILDSDKRMAKVVLAMREGASLDEAIERCKQEMDEVMRLLIKSILAMYDNLSARTLELAREIAARHKAETKQKLAASVFDNTLDAICIMDEQGNIIDANPAFSQTTQYSYEEVLGKNLELLKSGLKDESLAAVLWKQLKQEGNWSGKISNRNKEGELVAEWLTLSSVKDELGEISNYVGVFSNISYFIQQQHALEHIAHHDILTGLPNRILLYDRLELALAFSRRHRYSLAICYLDLDGFKPVNDNFGHLAGDLLLQEVAKRLSSIIRDEDTVARVGGDEFVILFGNLKNIECCKPLLNRVLEELNRPILLDNAMAHISASIGVTVFPQDNHESDVLLEHADQAMYQAKRLGKSRYCFYAVE